MPSGANALARPPSRMGRSTPTMPLPGHPRVGPSARVPPSVSRTGALCVRLRDAHATHARHAPARMDRAPAHAPDCASAPVQSIRTHGRHEVTPARVGARTREPDGGAGALSAPRPSAQRVGYSPRVSCLPVQVPPPPPRRGPLVVYACTGMRVRLCFGTAKSTGAWDVRRGAFSSLRHSENLVSPV